MNLSKSFTTLPIFPEACLYFCFLNVDNIKIMNYLKKLKYQKTNNNDENSYISSNLNIFKELKFLKKKINEHVHNYLNNILEYKIKYKFLNSWSTKTKINSFSEKHVHKNTFLSGVYYPFGNENFTIKFFKNDSSSFFEIIPEKYNHFNSVVQEIKILKNNSLILFPSNLSHAIAKNNSNFIRYSIAFNINPKGYIGKGDSKVFF